MRLRNCFVFAVFCMERQGGEGFTTTTSSNRRSTQQFQSQSSQTVLNAETSETSTDLLRRAILQRTLPTLISLPFSAGAVVEPPRSVVEVGGGFDLLSAPTIKEKDVVYPLSMEGIWTCQRIITQSEGDLFMAETAWKSLGGGKTGSTFKQAESFQVKFIRSDAIPDGVVLDRGFEMTSRTKSQSVEWNPEAPNVLAYDKTKLSVVQRSVEFPSDKGFGFNELYRIDEGPFTRATQVKRRYRRAFDDSGNRVVEGLEIMKTYRVLDGIAGTEIPTSLTKSQIRFTKP